MPLALFVAAVIWSFGHAAYPNQPWWIRGLEVGLAGLVFGLVLLRWGIVAVVACHFSVDALYTAFVMIRSGDPYFVATGALSAGLFGLLLVAAFVLYASKGGLLPAMTNEEEGVAPPLPPAPPRAALADAAASYRRSPAVISLIGILAAAGLGAAALVRVDAFGDWVDFKIGKQRARESAETFLRGHGFDVSSYRAAVASLDRTDSVAASYLRDKGGLSVVKTAYRDLVPTPLWRVRFFIPEKKEEYNVSVHPSTGAVLGFSRTLPDDAPGASLDKAEALARAETFMASMSQDPKSGVLKEQTEKDEKARRDHTLVWEYPIEAGGDAKVRYEVVVQGDAVGSWTRGVKIPEEWEREHTGLRIDTAIRIGYTILFSAILIAFAVILFVRLVGRGEIPWRFGLAAGIVSGLAGMVALLVNLEGRWAESRLYDTSMPELLFQITLIVAVVLAGVAYLLIALFTAGLAGGLHPRAQGMFWRRNRRVYAGDALLAGLVTTGLLVALPAFRRLLGSLIPSGILISGVGVTGALDANPPYVGVLIPIFFQAIFIPAVVAIAVSLLSHFFHHPALRAALALGTVLVLIPLGARTPAEFLVGGIQGAVVLTATVLLVRFFLRDNPLAWLWSAWLGFGVAAAAGLIAQSAPIYRNSGIFALAIILAPGLVLVADAIAGRRVTQAEPVADPAAP